jgi:RHS repeat-associated protein
VERDFRLTGPIPLDWRRHYDSSRAGVYHGLGWGHAHEYERTLQFDSDGMRYVGPLGIATTFPVPQRDGATEVNAGRTLRRLGPLLYRVEMANEPALEFAFVDPLLAAPLSALVRGTARITFHHDGKHALERITDSSGREIRVECDDTGRVLRLTLAETRARAQRDLVTYDFDTAGNLVRGVDAYRHAFSFEYDAANRLTRRTDRRGYSFHFEYDERGRCVRSAGEDGLYAVQLDYRPAELHTLVTQADGGVWEYRHDDAGLLTAVVDPYGGVRAFRNNEAGNVAEEVDPNGDVTTWVYDATGAFVGRRSSLGHFSADQRGPLRPDQRAHRVPSRPSEWECGDLLTAERLRQMDGSEDGEEYDELGTLLREASPEGRARHWVHDAGGNMVRYRDYDGSVYGFDYASWDLPSRDTDPIGRRRERVFTTTAAVAEVVEPGGVRTRYVYDLVGRVAEFWYDGLLVEAYRYDAAGVRTATLDGEGRPILEQEVGPRNLKVVRRLASGGTHRFQYTDRGYYAAVATNDANVKFEYDEFSNRTLDARGGQGVAHQFAGAGLLVQTTVLERFTTRYRWLSEAELEIRDPGGRTHTLGFPGGGAIVRSFSSGLAEVVRYDGRGQCVARASERRRTTARPAPWVRRFAYSGEGDLLEAYDSAAGIRRYEYDAAHRLRLLVADNGVTWPFRHDAGDNLMEQPGLSRVAVTDGNRLRSANGDDFEYDDRGNVSLRRGSRGVTRYRYDSRNMLVACDTSRGEWHATYDAFGRRIRKSLGAEWREFYWDTDRLAAEVSHDGRLRVYVYADAFAMVPLLWLDYDSVDADPASGRQHFILSDHLGTPLRVEDEQGAVVWQAQITPYGSAIVSDGARIEMPLRFPGHYHDVETGLHCNRFRYYVPELGRYLQPDPLRAGDGGNIYAYPANPLVEVDVRGDCAKTAKKKKEEAKKPESTEDGEAAEGEPKKPQLPPFDGETTHAVLVTNEGAVVTLKSGEKDPAYRNYPAAGHTEGKAAIYIRENGSSGGVVYHNNTDGTCGYCDKQITTLLPEGATLKVVPPENASANNSMAKDTPTEYTGNSNNPKLPKTKTTGE